MALANSITGDGKLVRANSEVRTWVEKDEDSNTDGEYYFTEVKETVINEDREWYALTESAVNTSIAENKGKIDPSDYTGVSRTTGLNGAFDFPKDTGAGTAMEKGDKVYWDDVNEVVVTTAGSFDLMGYVWEDVDTVDSEVTVMMAAYTQNASISDPVIGSYTLSINITAKVREYSALNY